MGSALTAITSVASAAAAGLLAWLALTGAGPAVAGLAAGVCVLALLALVASARVAAGRGRVAACALLLPPFAALAWIGVGPGAGPLLGVGLLVVVLARVLPAGTGSPLRAVSLGLLAAPLAALGFAAVWVAVAEPEVSAELSERRTRYVYDLDAAVPLEAVPACRPAVREHRTLGAGARPRFSSDGSLLWYDAPDEQGVRQIHRLELADGSAQCWTCGEPGPNRRARPAERGTALVFETGRHRDLRHPTGLDLHLIETRDTPPRHGSRRLTLDPVTHSAGALDPGGRVLFWARAEGGAHAIVTAGLQTGHGGLVLGAPTPILVGGLEWLMPLRWSRDARRLLYLAGQPYGARSLQVLDPATGDVLRLDVPSPRDADVTRDGSGWIAFGSRSASAAAALPRALGFLLGPLHAWFPAHAEPGTATVVLGRFGGASRTVDLGPLAHAGAVSGGTLAPDGRSFVLALDASDGERLVHAELDCDEG